MEKKVKANTTKPHGKGMKSRFYWEIFQINAQQDEVHRPCVLISPLWMLLFNCVSLKRLYIQGTVKTWRYAWEEGEPSARSKLGFGHSHSHWGKGRDPQPEQATTEEFQESSLNHSACNSTKCLQHT